MPDLDTLVRRTGAGAGLADLSRLTLAAARLWRRHFWALATWFCLGFAVHATGLQLSAELGAEHGVLAMIAFAIGVVASLVALVLMIHTVEPSLTALQVMPPAEARERLRVPAEVFVREARLEVVAAAVGPFLAVYAVWGFVEDEVRALFTSNYTVQGLGGIDNFSINLSPNRLVFYLLIGGSAWVLRQLSAAILRHRRALPVAFAGIVFEALWVFSLFAILLICARVVRTWLRTRAGWVGLQDGWRAVLDRLPDWPLPFDLTLPRAVDAALDALVGTVLPGAWQAVALPLVWLALTATVLGWREFRARDALAGTGLIDRAGRLRPLGTRSRTVAALLSADVRSKYVPVVQALRLIGQAGPRFVGVYLLLAAGLTALRKCFDIGLTVLVGPRDVATSLLVEPFATLASGVLFTTASVALYAAAFHQALGAAIAAPVSDAPPPPAARASNDIRQRTWSA